jgi:hypothetical protein
MQFFSELRKCLEVIKPLLRGRICRGNGHGVQCTRIPMLRQARGSLWAEVFVVRYFLSSRFHGIMDTSITGKPRHLDGSHRKRPRPEKLVFHIFSALAQFEWRLIEGWTRARL